MNYLDYKKCIMLVNASRFAYFKSINKWAIVK